jgi:hypothetical protein
MQRPLAARRRHRHDRRFGQRGDACCLVHEGLATATVGEPVKAGGKTVEVVRFTITTAGRRVIEG